MQFKVRVIPIGSYMLASQGSFKLRRTQISSKKVHLTRSLTSLIYREDQGHASYVEPDTYLANFSLSCTFSSSSLLYLHTLGSSSSDLQDKLPFMVISYCLRYNNNSYKISH